MRLPRVLSSPPSTAAGTNGAASAIASSVQTYAFEPGAFSFLGGPVAQDINIDGFSAKMGNYPYKTSPAPVTVEFWFDTADSTGRFEVYWKGGKSCRVAIQQSDGSWGYVSAAATFTHGAGGTYRDLVTLGAAGL